MDQDAFLQAIRDNPDDDAPRLVYADWLEERGDPRGEFIRVQCALARMDEYDPRRWDLLGRERALLRAHKTAWVGPAAGRVRFADFRRGFLDRVELDANAFVGVGDVLVNGGLVPEVRLFAARSKVADVLRASGRYVERLAFAAFSDFEEESLSSADVEVLAASSSLGSLRSLALVTDAGDEAIRHVTAAPWLSVLRELRLPNCRIGASGVEALTACPAVAGLTALDLSGNRATAAAAQALAASRHLGALRHLCLPHNAIDAAGAAALASCPRLGGLERLDLSSNPLGDAGVERLARSPHLRRLTDLRLARTWMRAAGVRALAGAPIARSLVHLDLSHNQLLAAGAGAVAGADFPLLERLVLTGAEIGDDGAKALAAAGLPALRSLHLGANGLRVWGVKEITVSARWPQLRVLDLHSNLLEDRGLQVLARWPGLANLSELDAPANAIGDVGALELAASPYTGGLRVANLSNNRISPAGVAALQSGGLGDPRRVTLRVTGNLLDRHKPS